MVVISVGQVFFSRFLDIFGLQVEQHTLEDFARSVISHDGDSVKTNLQKLHFLIVPDPKGGGIIESKGIMALLASGIMVLVLSIEGSWVRGRMNLGVLCHFLRWANPGVFLICSRLFEQI